jgi:phosphatidate cytidylyltransferase
VSTQLISRVLVAAVGVPVVLALVYLGGWWLFGLVAAAGLLALHEFWLMARSLRPLALAGYIGGAATLVGAQLGGSQWALGGFLTTLALAFVLKGLAETRTTTTAAVGATVLGTAWIGFGLAHVLLLRDVDDHGRLLAFTILLAVWAADTAAYFVGRLIGRHKLAPVVSPGKTWEGLVAGTALAIAVPFFALYEDRETFLEIWEALVLGAAIAVAAPLGDLFESALKRDMQVKDSGRLLGGHGGVLDRIDALLFTSIAAYYTVAALGYA